MQSGTTSDPGAGPPCKKLRTTAPEEETAASFSPGYRGLQSLMLDTPGLFQELLVRHGMDSDSRLAWSHTCVSGHKQVLMYSLDMTISSSNHKPAKVEQVNRAFSIRGAQPTTLKVLAPVTHPLLTQLAATPQKPYITTLDVTAGADDQLVSMLATTFPHVHTLKVDSIPGPLTGAAQLPASIHHLYVRRTTASSLPNARSCLPQLQTLSVGHEQYQPIPQALILLLAATPIPHLTSLHLPDSYLCDNLAAGLLLHAPLLHILTVRTISIQQPLVCRDALPLQHLHVTRPQPADSKLLRAITYLPRKAGRPLAVYLASAALALGMDVLGGPILPVTEQDNQAQAPAVDPDVLLSILPQLKLYGPKPSAGVTCDWLNSPAQDFLQYATLLTAITPKPSSTSIRGNVHLTPSTLDALVTLDSIIPTTVPAATWPSPPASALDPPRVIKTVRQLALTGDLRHAEGLLKSLPAVTDLTVGSIGDLKTVIKGVAAWNMANVTVQSGAADVEDVVALPQSEPGQKLAVHLVSLACKVSNCEVVQCLRAATSHMDVYCKVPPTVTANPQLHLDDTPAAFCATLGFVLHCDSLRFPRTHSIKYLDKNMPTADGQSAPVVHITQYTRHSLEVHTTDTRTLPNTAVPATVPSVIECATAAPTTHAQRAYCYWLFSNYQQPGGPLVVMDEHFLLTPGLSATSLDSLPDALSISQLSAELQGPTAQPMSALPALPGLQCLVAHHHALDDCMVGTLREHFPALSTLTIARISLSSDHSTAAPWHVTQMTVEQSLNLGDVVKMPPSSDGSELEIHYTCIESNMPQDYSPSLDLSKVHLVSSEAPVLTPAATLKTEQQPCALRSTLAALSTTKIMHGSMVLKGWAMTCDLMATLASLPPKRVITFDMCDWGLPSEDYKQLLSHLPRSLSFVTFGSQLPDQGVVDAVSAGAPAGCTLRVVDGGVLELVWPVEVPCAGPVTAPAATASSVQAAAVDD